MYLFFIIINFVKTAKTAITKIKFFDFIEILFVSALAHKDYILYIFMIMT